jgi:hypothetical protein
MTDRIQFKSLEAKTPAQRRREALAELNKTFNEIAHEYRPYDTLPGFADGVDAYMDRNYENPFTDPRDGVKAQAWDRGAEAAMRFTRQHHF